MKKRTFAILLAAIMLVTVLAACGGGGGSGDAGTGGGTGGGDPVAPGETVGTINVWSFTVEVPEAVERFKEMNPDFPYDIRVTVIPTDGGGYQEALDQALLAGGADAPDIFTAESGFVLKYTQVDLAHIALPYDDLFDNKAMDMVNAAQIATYAWELGTRPSDGKLVGLPFQNTGSAFIYRRSLATEIWGTDDPKTIEGKIGPGWNKFLEAAQEAKDKGIAILPGEGDAWQAIRSGATTPWIVNDKLVLDAHREQYLDIGYALYNNDFTLKAGAWGDAWFGSMSGTTDPPVLGLLGPAWLINYVLADDNYGDTWGDWAICNPPTGFSWGGTWVIANSRGNVNVRQGVATLIDWITLDTSDTGFQYYFANGTLFEGSTKFAEAAAKFAEGLISKDAVASNVVMNKSNGELSILSGQDMFDVFIPAGANASGAGFGPYDETINREFADQAEQFFMGEKTKEQAIADFKQKILDEMDIGS